MSIYQSIYDIIVTHIFGGLELTASQTLVTELYSLGLCFFCVSLPFIFIFGVVFMLVLAFRR